MTYDLDLNLVNSIKKIKIFINFDHYKNIWKVWIHKINYHILKHVNYENSKTAPPFSHVTKHTNFYIFFEYAMKIQEISMRKHLSMRRGCGHFIVF